MVGRAENVRKPDPLLAPCGHALRAAECPPSEAKRTFREDPTKAVRIRERHLSEAMSALGAKADITFAGSAFAVAIGGKADMTYRNAHVCF